MPSSPSGVVRIAFKAPILRSILACVLLGLFAAGIPKTDMIHKMYYENRIVEGQEGEVWLTNRTNRRPVWQDPEGPDWIASAPHIRAANGRYLAFDVGGEDPTLSLALEKGTNCEWGFEIVGELMPQKKGKRGPTEGFVGTQAKLKATAGPFQGRFVGLGPARRFKSSSGQDELRSPLVLVDQPKEAITLTFLTKRVWVHHN